MSKPNQGGEWDARRVVSTRDSPRIAVLLGVDTGGHEDARPILTWTAPDVLQVTIPHSFYLKISMRRFDSIRVKLRFQSDDPAERAARKRQLDMVPDPDR